VDFGPHAHQDLDQEHIRFFDRVLKGVDDTDADHLPITLFDMGAKVWRTFSTWPQGEMSLHLAGSGRASIDTADGMLQSQPGAADGLEHIVHDPWRPVPVVGGCYGVPPGPVDRHQTDERGDVLTFTTVPLEEDMLLAGEPRIQISASCDRTSFDLSCILSVVASDGTVFQISGGYAHYRAADAGVFDLTLTATCVTVCKGERLRLSIAASDYPAHPVNPGTGEDPVSTPKTNAVVITIAIAHGPSGLSVLHLPVIETSEGAAG
jgi:putative CocE/NonD family hydrolase